MVLFGLTLTRFNTQPPKGGWASSPYFWPSKIVSTHSRLKAAGAFATSPVSGATVSTHSRLKAAGQQLAVGGNGMGVSTHSRLKAAGKWIRSLAVMYLVSTHSRLKAAGYKCAR